MQLALARGLGLVEGDQRAEVVDRFVPQSARRGEAERDLGRQVALAVDHQLQVVG